MKFFLKVLVTSLAVVVAAYLLPGVDLQNFLTAVFVAFVLGILNMLLKPILVLLTIPVTIFSFGLFLLVINAFIVLLADFLVGGFEVHNFWWALLFSILLSVVSYLLELPVKRIHPRQ
ncbi:MAG TPA: phage holin family protein [Bacteroidales bacterium]|nr:phage holin family protein [Bacteroidales bacterium]